MDPGNRTLFDYVATVAYRKFEREALNVPAFHAGEPPAMVRLSEQRPRYLFSDLSTMDRTARETLARTSTRGMGMRLPTHLRSRIGSLSAVIAGARSTAGWDVVTALSHVLAYCGRPLRWEPFNTYQIHRGIASARCLFTCDVRVAMREAGGLYRLYRYISDDHVLLRLDDQAVETTLFGDAPLAFAISGDVGKCVDPYGEFAPNLVAPEAGLFLGQLELLCAAVGWRTDAAVDFDVDVAREVLRLAHETDMPLSIVTIDYGDTEPGSRNDECVEFSEPCWPRDLVAQFGVLTSWRDMARATPAASRARTSLSARCRALPPLPSRDDGAVDERHEIDVLDLLRQRNSGSYLIGFAPRAEGFDGAGLDRLLSDWLWLTRISRSNELASVDVGVLVSVLRVAGRRPASYRMNVRAGTVTLIEERDFTEAFASASTMPMANFRELNIVVTFTCDFGRELRALGASAYSWAHQATGWLAHAFGLAAARQGMFSRPVRMYDDGRLDALIPFDGQPTLQLLCGHNRGARLTFEIG